MRKFLGVAGLLLMVGSLAACESAKSMPPAAAKPAQQAPAGKAPAEELGE